MPLTVKQLICELKKYPQDSIVGYAHHDNADNEIAGTVSCVEGFDPEESDEPESNRRIRVVLRG